MARGDGTNTQAYDPENRADGMQTVYMVNNTGDRWFIPYNSDASMADQLAQCDKMVGDTDDGTPAGVENVVS